MPKPAWLRKYLGDIRQGPLPFVIGVTGHRDLRPEDVDLLKKAVGEIIDQFRKKMPRTPMIVLSALADGADRLVAMVALEKKIRVIVPLPMQQNLYENDFSAESLQEFHDLLDRVGAENKFELPLVEGNTKEEILTGGRKRDLQYAQVGQYIALHSHLVMALWDGLDPQKLGGTADVVKMCLNEGRMEEMASGSSWLNYEDECRPVYQVLTPRTQTPNNGTSTPDLGQLITGRDKPANPRLIYPGGGESIFKDSWKNTDRFNRDYLCRLEPIKQGKDSSLKMFESTDPGELKRAAELADVFVAADQLALHIKRIWEKTVMVIHVLAVLSIYCLAVVSNLSLMKSPENAYWAKAMWVAFRAFSIGAFAVWASAGLWKIHNRFLDYRGLAEALRVQFYWNVAGIHDIEVADYYLRYQLNKMNWIRAAARVCCIGRVEASAHSDVGRLQRVFDNWIKDQSDYFNQATPKRDARSRRLSLWGLVWVVVAMICAALPSSDAVGALSLGHASGLIKMLATAMLGTAAVLLGYGGILAVEEESRLFKRMQTIYNRADRFRARLLPLEMGATVNLPNARKIIHELGNEALEENGDWIVMHRAHPIGLPIWKPQIDILKRLIGMIKEWVGSLKWRGPSDRG